MARARGVAVIAGGDQVGVDLAREFDFQCLFVDPVNAQHLARAVVEFAPVVRDLDPVAFAKSQQIIAAQRAHGNRVGWRAKAVDGRRDRGVFTRELEPRVWLATCLADLMDF